MVAVGATERIAAAKFLIQRPAFFARLGRVRLIHLNDLAPRKESHLGFQSFSKSIVGTAKYFAGRPWVTISGCDASPFTIPGTEE